MDAGLEIAANDTRLDDGTVVFGGNNEQTVGITVDEVAIGECRSGKGHGVLYQLEDEAHMAAYRACAVNCVPHLVDPVDIAGGPVADKAATTASLEYRLLSRICG